jgi:hypothetical protein
MTRQELKEIAIDMARAAGLDNLVCSELCEAANLPRGSFAHVTGGSFSEFVDELRPHVTHAAEHPLTKSRVAPGVRSAHIKGIALEMAKAEGYLNIKREDLAARANVSEATVARYTGTRKGLQDAIMAAALEQGVAEIVAQGLANGDPLAKAASIELKAEAATYLVNL